MVVFTLDTRRTYVLQEIKTVSVLLIVLTETFVDGLECQKNEQTESRCLSVVSDI